MKTYWTGGEETRYFKLQPFSQFRYKHLGRQCASTDFQKRTMQGRKLA